MFLDFNINYYVHIYIQVEIICIVKEKVYDGCSDPINIKIWKRTW